MNTSTHAYFTGVAPGYFPIAWGEQRAIVTPAQAAQVRRGAAHAVWSLRQLLGAGHSNCQRTPTVARPSG